MMTVEDFAERYDEWAEEYDEENDNEFIRTSEKLVIEYASPTPEDTVVDIGTGTGAIALGLSDNAGTVIGRDISESMLERAREKAAEQGIENVKFGVGSFRYPNVEHADIVVSNFALHHLGDEGKRDAFEAIAELNPRRFVTGHCMFFGETDPEVPPYNQESIYPSTVGHLADVLTDAGFMLTEVEKIHEHVGVLVADRADS